jgi:hypothetical protein
MRPRRWPRSCGGPRGLLSWDLLRVSTAAHDSTQAGLLAGWLVVFLLAVWLLSVCLLRAFTEVQECRQLAFIYICTGYMNTQLFMANSMC